LQTSCGLGLNSNFSSFSIDVEMDYSSSNINVCSHGAEEWSPKDERRFFSELHVQHHKVDRDEIVLDFHWNVFRDSCRVVNR
jgi:hypothetical protein